MNLTIKKMLAKKTFKVKCLCVAFAVLMVIVIALTLNAMFANAAMPEIWLDTPAKGKVVNVNTNLKIRQSPGDMSVHSGIISNGTTLEIIGYTEYDPSDPWSPWLAIDTSENKLLKPSNYSIGWVSGVYVNVPVTGVAMTETAKNIKVGTTANIGYAVIPPCADNTSVTWSSSNTSIATVDGYGKVTAKKAGTVVITVRTSDGGKTATCTYTVKPLVSEVKLNKTTSSLGIGKSETLTATIFPTDAFDKSLTWNSSDTAIATVDQNGKVTGKTDGTVTITATAKDGSGKSASCTYTILPLVNSVTLNKDSTELNIAETETLTAIVLPDEAYDKTLTWSSADSSVASVDQNGVVTAKTSGTTKIKAIANDGSGTYDTCTVVVKTPVTGITLNKTISNIYIGKSETLVATIVPSNASNKILTWRSSDESVVVVNQNGIVTGKASGRATITVTSNDGSNKSASCEYTVLIPVSDVKLNKNTSTVPVGRSEKLTAIIEPSNAHNQTLLWSSNDTNVVSVDSNGCVIAKAPGTAVVKAIAKDGSGASASCKYTVSWSPSGLALNKKTSTLKVGTNETLKTIFNADATYREVKWISSNSSIATVDKNGKVTAIKAGTATITATLTNGSGQSASCTYTIKPLVSEIKLNKSSISILIGENYKFTETVKPIDAFDTSVTWSSSDTSVATVDQNGNVNGKSAGKTTIKVTANDGSGVIGKCEVTVTIPVSSISINKDYAVIMKDSTLDLNVSVLPANANNKSVTWSSDNTSIATVDESGRVTAKSAGTAIITATANDGSNKSDICEVIVVLPVTSITINPAKVKIIAGETYRLTAIIEPENAYNSNITWSSDNTSIATVDQNGNVKGKSAGKTIIKATAKDGSGVVARCEVTVTMPVSRVSVDKNSVIIRKGDSLTLNATVLPTDANDKSLTWSSSNTNVATVDQNGKVTAVHGGKATITATARDGSGKYDTCEVQVIVMVDSIVLNKSSMSMSKGEQTKLIATVKPDDATNKSVTWSSSDPAYAYVDENGKVIARSGGKVNITATSNQNSSVSATCEIIINYPITGWIANIDYNSTLNIRKTPNANGEIVTTAPYATKLTVTAPAVNGWYPVKFANGTKGYASADYVVFYEPSSLVNTASKISLFIIPNPNPLSFSLSGGTGTIIVKNYNTGVVFGKPDSFYWDAVKITSPSWVTVRKIEPGIVEVVISETNKPRSGNIEFSSPYAGTAKWAQYSE